MHVPSTHMLDAATHAAGTHSYYGLVFASSSAASSATSPWPHCGAGNAAAGMLAGLEPLAAILCMATNPANVRAAAH